jgi:hypothetical protein
MGGVVSVTPRPRFSTGDRTPGTHYTGGWVGHRADLDTEVRRKILWPLSWIEPRSPGRPSRSQTPYWLSYPADSYLITLRKIPSSAGFLACNSPDALSVVLQRAEVQVVFIWSVRYYCPNLTRLECVDKIKFSFPISDLKKKKTLQW